MKKTLIGIIVIMLVLSLFMTSALAAKPADKPAKPDKETKQEERDDKKAEQEAEKEARAAFKAAAAPLRDTIHANRAEWGAMGDQQEALSASIEAKIAAIGANGYVLDAAALAAIQANCAAVKDMQAQARSLKRDIQSLWKSYINAKKESDVDAGVAALSGLIAKQETRLALRSQIIATLAEIDAAMDAAAPPAEDGSGDGEDGPVLDDDDDDDDEEE